MTAVWDNGPEDRTETMVLLALADHANDDGKCYPSISHLTDKCRLSRQGVCNVLDRLEDDGWISRKRGGGRGNPTHYTLSSGRLVKQSSQLDGKKDINSQADTINSQADKDKQSSSLDGNHQEPSRNRQDSAPARKDDGQAPVTQDRAVEIGKMIGVSERLCHEWWLYYDEKGWPNEVRNVKSALRRWKLNDSKYSNGELKHSDVDIPDEPDPEAQEQHRYGWYYDDDGYLRSKTGQKLTNARGYALQR